MPLGAGVPLKRSYFAVIGSFSVEMVADRYRHAAYHKGTGDRLLRFINTDDLELPKKGFLVNFFRNF